MAYLCKAIEGHEAALAELHDPMAPSPPFPAEILERANRLEIWHSSYLDPGEDYTDWILFSKFIEIDRRRVPGY